MLSMFVNIRDDLSTRYALCSSTLLHDMYVCTVSLTCLNMSRTDYTVVCITKFRPKIVRPFFTFNHPNNILMLATDIWKLIKSVKYIVKGELFSWDQYDLVHFKEDKQFNVFGWFFIKFAIVQLLWERPLCIVKLWVMPQSQNCPKRNATRSWIFTLTK